MALEAVLLEDWLDVFPEEHRSSVIVYRLRG